MRDLGWLRAGFVCGVTCLVASTATMAPAQNHNAPPSHQVVVRRPPPAAAPKVAAPKAAGSVAAPRPVAAASPKVTTAGVQPQAGATPVVVGSEMNRIGPAPGTYVSGQAPAQTLTQQGATSSAGPSQDTYSSGASKAGQVLEQELPVEGQPAKKPGGHGLPSIPNVTQTPTTGTQPQTPVGTQPQAPVGTQSSGVQPTGMTRGGSNQPQPGTQTQPAAGVIVSTNSPGKRPPKQPPYHPHGEPAPVWPSQVGAYPEPVGGNRQGSQFVPQPSGPGRTAPAVSSIAQAETPPAGVIDPPIKPLPQPKPPLPLPPQPRPSPLAAHAGGPTRSQQLPGSQPGMAESGVGAAAAEMPLATPSAAVPVLTLALKTRKPVAGRDVVVDVGLKPQIEGAAYRVDWGDGSPEESVSGAGVAEHRYAKARLYRVSANTYVGRNHLYHQIPVEVSPVPVWPRVAIALALAGGLPFLGSHIVKLMLSASFRVGAPSVPEMRLVGREPYVSLSFVPGVGAAEESITFARMRRQAG